MPAQAPPLGDALLTALQALGAELRLRRERLGITAMAAAESAGMSRWSWARIEAGEPSVTMGAYLGAAQALGLELQWLDPNAPAVQPAPDIASVRIDRYPQLQRLAWQQAGTTELTAQEALAVYERNWRHVDQEKLEPRERELIDTLTKAVGGGRPLV